MELAVRKPFCKFCSVRESRIEILLYGIGPDVRARRTVTERQHPSTRRSTLRQR
jgi:hypothetical protein